MEFIVNTICLINRIINSIYKFVLLKLEKDLIIIIPNIFIIYFYYHLT
jgi:hypothetical protein